MDENYDVYLADKPIGKVYVQRQGLYLHFHCRCQLSGEVIYKLIATCGKYQENLGILVPVDGDFGLDTRLPLKRLREGELCFRAVPRHTELCGKFIPLAPEEPFHYIARLKDSYLENRNGRLGIVIKEQGCE